MVSYFREPPACSLVGHVTGTQLPQHMSCTPQSAWCLPPRASDTLAALCDLGGAHASDTLAALCDLGGAHVSVLLFVSGCVVFGHVTAAYSECQLHGHLRGF